jgi:hypothetical protein
MKAEIYFLGNESTESLGEISIADVPNINKAFKNSMYFDADGKSRRYEGFSFENDGETTKVQFKIDHQD